MPPQKKRQNSVDKDGTGDDLKKPKLVQTDEEHEDEEESSEESDSKSDDGSEDEANKEKLGLPFANKSPKESLIKMTFEFNDIKEDYAEGITLVSRNIMPFVLPI